LPSVSLKGFSAERACLIAVSDKPIGLPPLEGHLGVSVGISIWGICKIPPNVPPRELGFPEASSDIEMP
jgi:hypothetical protein